MAEDKRSDPYKGCEKHCHHDLGTGVRISDLLGDDGPFPLGDLLVQFSPRRVETPGDLVWLTAHRDGVRLRPARR
jgi:hypothetical protein